MRKILVRVIKYALSRAKRSRLIQNLFEQPVDLSSYPVFREFTDSDQRTYKLYSGLRSKIKPGWENVLKTYRSQLPADQNVIRQKVSNGRIMLEKFEPVIDTFSSGISGSRILEIGCHDGAFSYALAEKGAKEVTGSEYSGYKIDAVDSTGITTDKSDHINNELAELRDKVSVYFDETSNVNFIDDNICESGLDPDSYDIVCSIDVFEHLTEPEKALSNIARVLKKGGVSIHEYNPFMSLNGGHSLCTLDFLWGHVCLNEDDFVRYIKEIRPDEYEPAVSFYKNGLNRMTIEDMKRYCAQSGLEILEMIKFTKEQHLRMLKKETLNICKRNYPDLTAEDLVTPRIIVIFLKK